MKVGLLIKYSICMLLLMLITFLLMTVFIYYFSLGQNIEIGYSFIVPVCMFVSALMYSNSVKDKGLLRGLEIWTVYFLAIWILKAIMSATGDLSIANHLLFLPIAILGGIIGVNLKK